MSTSHEFLNHYLTNTYVLSDYTEIAYIVCSHNPPSEGETYPNELSSDQTLLRLRNAERQFRQASILAALDVEKLELFTFYKKVDVVKDQRTILSKFGHVCRLNSCSIARKSAARIVDLLKPDSSRVYQLFVHAMLQNIQLQFSSEKPIFIGSKVFLCPPRSTTLITGLPEATGSKLWYLNRMVIQVLASGQVVLTLQRSKSGPLILLSEMDDGESQPSILATGQLLYLAPAGQLARYKAGRRGPSSDLDHAEGTVNNGTETAGGRQTSWTTYFLSWLGKRGSDVVNLSADDTWIEVEIPLFERFDNASQAPRSVLAWRSILWPTRLAYVFAKTPETTSMRDSRDIKLDPLQFAQDWYNDSTERSSLVAAAQAASDKDPNRLEDDVYLNDEVSFGYQEQGDREPVHAFEPPAFPPSQMIYPTPPDGQMTHPTPGVSSIDGLAPTPLQSSQQTYAPPDQVPDLEMQDVNSTNQQAEDADAQDEDLFGGMPDDNFDTDLDLDEPNWDIFDEPDFKEPKTAEPSHGNSTEAKTDQEKHETPVLSSAGAMNPRELVDIGQVQGSNRSADRFEKPFDVEVDMVTDGVSPQGSPKVRSTEAKMQDGEGTRGSEPIEDDHTTDGVAARSVTSTGRTSRKSSVYENVDIKPSTAHYDSKYKSQGKYWFNPMAVSAQKNQSVHRSTDSIRPASSGSDTSESSGNSSSSGGNAPHRLRGTKIQRAWTDYEPEKTDAQDLETSHPASNVVRNDNASIMRTITSARIDEPFLYDVTQLQTAEQGTIFDQDEDMVTMIAQIMVDQMSQSSILRDTTTLSLCPEQLWCDVEVSLNYSEAKRNIPNAPLGELTGMNSGAATSTLAEKITALSRPRIAVKRGDEVIRADATILRFWDTLGLQPMHGAKDITAFCLCPAGDTMVNASSTFLKTMSDTYTGCNFGSHVAGEINGLGGNGILTWQNGIPGAKLFCQRVGVGLASASQIRGTVVLYMICPTPDMHYYRDICHAFALLFEAFAKSSTDLAHEVELVLQLIPLSFIASAETLVVPSRERYLQLATEVYNRVPGHSDGLLPAACASAVTLDRPLLKDIDFDLTTNAADPLSKEGSCLHLAYSYSADGRWLSAAWSDEIGTKSLTMSYFMRERDASGRVRRDVLRDMWDISHDIMKQEARRWRLAVVKSGFFVPEELNEWLQLAGQNSTERRPSAKIILLSVDVDATINLEAREPLARTQTTTASASHNTGTTPATTPQNNSSSPDHGVAATPTPGALSHINPSTPPEHNFDSSLDAESTLVDPNEESWAVVFGFGVNQSDDVLAVRPAGASGLLVKRATDQDHPSRLTTIGVHLSATSRSTPTSPTPLEREVILQDMLGQFRRLATLAATRGCINKERECVPWHIATAMKGARVLGHVM